MNDMEGMDMSNMGSSFLEGKNNIFCWLGNHNGTYPNGTMGDGTWTEFGYYSPSMDELMGCQAGNDPWSDSVKYAEWTAYIVLAYFAVVAAWNHFSAWNNLNRSIGLFPVVPIPAKLKALIRSLDMARPDTRLPAFGTQVVSLALLLFACVVIFAIFPYYRPPNFGSSPLGLRSEWIATALIVFIIATAVKRNALSFLTGLPYPRLLDLHKTISWVAFSAAIVHAGAMIVRANRQQPWWYSVMSDPLCYGWAAWGALVTMAWLCIASLSPLRRLSHEFFYLTHMTSVLLFLVFMYYHCDNLLSSWAWLHAAVVVLAVGVLYRFGLTAWHTCAFLRPQRASVEVLSGGALLIRVKVGEKMAWHAGEHVFLRFGSLKLFPWQSHPFTIANLPQSSAYPSRSTASSVTGENDLEKRISPNDLPTLPSSSSSSAATTNEMHLLLRPHTGLTSRLFRLASSSGSPLVNLPVYLDGPYSSHGSSSSALTSLTSADSALLVAGGTGASFVLPLLLEALRREGGGRLRSVEVVWTVRGRECYAWYGGAVGKIGGLVKEYGVDLRVKLYVSRGGQEEGEKEKKVDEDIEVASPSPSSFSSSSASIPSFVEVIPHRVDGSSAVCSALALAGKRGAKKLAVLSCGPPSLALSVRNACHRAQVEILKGRLAPVEEVELVEEVFDC